MRRSLCVVLGLLLSVSACAAPRSDGRGTEIGMLPVNYRLPRLTGGQDALDAHRGRVVLLDLWASWCPPCREELPALSALAQDNHQVVVLTANQGEAPNVIRDLVEHEHLHLPVLLDKDQEYGAAYATVGLPTAVILDPHGKIAAIEAGAHSLQEWQTLLAKVGSR